MLRLHMLCHGRVYAALLAQHSLAAGIAASSTGLMQRTRRDRCLYILQSNMRNLCSLRIERMCC